MKKVIWAAIMLLVSVSLSSYCTQAEHVKERQRTGKKQYLCAIRPESFYTKRPKVAKKLYKNGLCTMCGCPDATHVSNKKKS